MPHFISNRYTGCLLAEVNPVKTVNFRNDHRHMENKSEKLENDTLFPTSARLEAVGFIFKEGGKCQGYITPVNIFWIGLKWNTDCAALIQFTTDSSPNYWCNHRHCAVAGSFVSLVYPFMGQSSYFLFTIAHVRRTTAYCVESTSLCFINHNHIYECNLLCEEKLKWLQMQHRKQILIVIQSFSKSPYEAEFDFCFQKDRLSRQWR